MSDPRPVKLEKACAHIRHKLMYSETSHAVRGMVDDSSDTRVFFCVKTFEALGLAPESVLIYDMEAYRTGEAACRAGVLAFLSAWTARLHDRGYLSGFYSSMSSGVADQVANYHTVGYARPDHLDFAIGW